jgi:AcrR family transcriptional regulator
MPQVKPSRRPYSSPIREEQARTTRKRILTAAHASFIKHGYSGTRVTDVARSAVVSPETIYATFGGKRGLLEGVIELAITGPDEVPLEQQEWVAEIAALPTAAERLRAFVRGVCRVLARTSPVHVVIRGAADREEFAVILQQGLLRTRLAKQTQVLQAFVGGALRPGLSIDEAAQRFCALSSPELHHLLIGQLGWTRERHEAWFAEMAKHDLLGTDTATR